MAERRKLSRKYLIFFGRIFDRRTGQLLGNVADITAEGAMVISSHPIGVDQDFQLRLDLASRIFGTDHLNLDGHSIWCQPDIDPAYYNTGFQFSGITPEDIELIDRIVEEYKIRD
ncbi:MAG: PilZ domain-containing protein [Chloroflexota bacterium]